MRVRISYSPNLWEIGTVREVDDDDARRLIREGRAVAYYGTDEPDPQPPVPSVTTIVPAATTPARPQSP